MNDLDDLVTEVLEEEKLKGESHAPQNKAISSNICVIINYITYAAK